MRYLRLFSVLVLSIFAITGCHRKREQVMPAPQAQAPIVTTLPPVPPLTFPDVQLAKPKPATPVVQAAPPPKPNKPRIQEKVRHHRVAHKVEPDTSAVIPPAPTPDIESSLPSPAPASAASVLGQLSADDATVNPHENMQTQRLIQRTEDRLKKISSDQQAEHKDAIAQVSSFLAQAKQAWAMNDVVGAETLANKAKILLDELLK
jgi:hypothetical protein